MLLLVLIISPWVPFPFSWDMSDVRMSSSFCTFSNTYFMPEAGKKIHNQVESFLWIFSHTTSSIDLKTYICKSGAFKTSFNMNFTNMSFLWRRIQEMFHFFESSQWAQCWFGPKAPRRQERFLLLLVCPDYPRGFLKLHVKLWPGKSSLICGKISKSFTEWCRTIHPTSFNCKSLLEEPTLCKSSSLYTENMKI